MDGNGQYPRTYLEVSMLPNGAHAEARPWAHGAGNLWNNQRLLRTLAPAPRRSRARRRRTQQTRADVGPVWCEAQLCDTCWCRPRAIVLLDFLSPTHGEYKRTKHACMQVVKPHTKLRWLFLLVMLPCLRGAAASRGHTAKTTTFRWDRPPDPDAA